MKCVTGTVLKLFVGACVLGGIANAQQTTPAATPHKKPMMYRQVRAVLSPSGFPITLTAYDRMNKDGTGYGTILQIAKAGYKSMKPQALMTKDLSSDQISSVVSWHNAERTHFGFLVLTTPQAGNLYSVMFFLYHDGQLTMPIDRIATGYPVFPTIKHTEKSGQIQVEMYDGAQDATNDKVRTLVVYTWSDYRHQFVKNVHRVAAASASRTMIKKEEPAPKKIEMTSAARAAGKG